MQLNDLLADLLVDLVHDDELCYQAEVSATMTQRQVGLLGLFVDDCLLGSAPAGLCQMRDVVTQHSSRDHTTQPCVVTGCLAMHPSLLS